MGEIVHLAAAADPRLDAYLRLREVALRQRWETENGIYIAEGDKVIRRAATSGHQFASFLMAPRWRADLADIIESSVAPCFVLDAAKIEQLTGFHVHRGALAAVHRPPALSLQQVAGSARRIVVLEDLVDHANVGALIRSAAAMGVDGVLVTPRCADPLYRRAVRVSMGTVFQVPWTRIESWPASIGTLQDAGFVVAGMTLGPEAITLDELVANDHDKLVLVFGSEGHGLTRATENRLNFRVTIPMMGGVDSLNVAAASAVALYATR